MSGLEIRLLGGFEVQVDGRPVTSFESATTRALLARLAVAPGRLVSRQALAELLWPGRPAGGALANLRHSLSIVRRAIGDRDREQPRLRTTSDGVSLAPDVTVDAVAFLRLAAMPVSSPGAVAAWEEAVALRRGPFLDGFDASLSDEWETWLQAVRTGIDRTAAEAFRRLAELRARTGEWSSARDYVDRWLAIDPWDEAAHRIRMRLLAEGGDATAALAHAERLAVALRAELGVEPSPEMAELVEAIRSRRHSVARPGWSEPPVAEPPLPEPCVGRDAERAWLVERLDDALAGAGGLVFVAGEAGSGKSLLLRAFAADSLARMDRLLVLSSACNAYTGTGDPLLPFRRMLAVLGGDVERAWGAGWLTGRPVAALLDDLPAFIETILEEGPYLLGTLVDASALASRFAAVFPDHPVQARLAAAAAAAEVRAGDPSRRQPPLLDQCCRVLLRLAAHRPLLLLVDDLQWADQGTLELLLHLARHLPGSSLLLAGAFRPDDVSGHGTDRIRLVVDEARALFRADCLLELTGSRHFVDAWLDHEPNLLDEAFRDRLHRLTDGHALFTGDARERAAAPGWRRAMGGGP